MGLTIIVWRSLFFTIWCWKSDFLSYDADFICRILIRLLPFSETFFSNIRSDVQKKKLIETKWGNDAVFIKYCMLNYIFRLHNNGFCLQISALERWNFVVKFNSNFIYRFIMLGNYNLPHFWTDSNSKYISSGKEIIKCDIHRDLHEVTVHNNNLGYSHITVIKILNDFIYKENVAGFIPRFTSRILYFFEICILKNQALSQLFIFWVTVH